MLTLNLNKTHFIEFKTKNFYQVQTKVQYDYKDISSSTETKFLGLIIDETISWNRHIDVIANKLCSACFVLRNLNHIVPQTTLRKIYFAHIHSMLSYGIIFWRNSTNANKLFIIQKKIVRILSNIGPRIWELWHFTPSTSSHWSYLLSTTNTYSSPIMNYITTLQGIMPICTCQLSIYPNFTKDPSYRVLRLLITCLDT